MFLLFANKTNVIKASKNDIEIWKTYPGTNYKVSNLGRVKSPNMMLLPSVTPQGYYTATIYNQKFKNKSKSKKIFVHVLVLTVFDKPRPKGLITRHLDGNPSNNRLYNLKWGTDKENHEDSVKHGTHVPPPLLVQIGELNHSVKLTEQDVVYIRQTNKSAKALAKELEITQWTVFDIRKRRSWAHIP